MKSIIAIILLGVALLFTSCKTASRGVGAVGSGIRTVGGAAGNVAGGAYNAGRNMGRGAAGSVMGSSSYYSNK